MEVDELTKNFIGITSNLKDYEGKLREYANGQGSKFTAWRDKTRAIVYGSSAACVAAGPFAIFVCPAVYGTAAGILETKINDERRRTDNTVNKFNGYANGFDALEKMSNSASGVAKQWYDKVNSL